MKNLGRIFFVVGLAVLALISAAGIYLWHNVGLRYYSVQSGSMSPALRTGDLTIDKKISATDIKTGDVISYASLANPKILISHRVVSVNTNAKTITTKGDNLSSEDPPVAFVSVRGQVYAHIPLAGYLIDALKKPAGLILLIYIPAIAITFAEASRLIKRPNTYKHPKLS